MEKIKKLFVWLFTTIGLVLVIVGSVGFLNLALRQYVFTKADDNCYLSQPVSDPNGKRVDDKVYLENCQRQQTSNKQSSAANSLAELIVGFPVLAFFYSKARKED